MGRWIGFHLLVLILLVVDLLIYRKREMKQKAALISSVAGVVIALLFNGYIFLQMGSERGIEFFTSYIVEKSLSIDNLFVFLMIFAYFKVPKALQHKALYFGVVGAFVLRLGLILGGVALINRFDWVTYFLGAIVGYTGVMLIFDKQEEFLEESGILRWIRRHFKVTTDYVKDQLIVKRKGLNYLTPLFLVMVMIETSDVLFALDSVPAVLAITKDPFIAYTSNVLAVLGLRSLFFLMEPWLSVLSRLKIGLGAILVFIGVKMLASFVIYIPLLVSLAVIGTILGISLMYSVLKKG
ncbi:MAG TPA: TerC/Alx family metal homeostasis membrane protein [Rhabdochlamydiaceae bacterium]|nr:TerC/Alx family metal homeostasis membrane protein [Rhabdochlamydiaceae bacterium]